MAFRTLFPACVVMLVLAVALGCSNGGPPSAGPKVSQWGEAAHGDAVRVVECPGVIKARPQGLVRVGSRLKGQLVRMEVRTGDVVRKGQLLALLDDRELRTQRDQAQARLEAAQAELDRTGALYDSRQAEARATVAAEQSRLSYAARTSERSSRLRAKGHVSQDSLENSRKDEAVAAQSVRAGESVARRLASERTRDIEKARSDVEAARAAVEQAEVYLSMTRIESPIDGIVGQVHTQEGEQVVAELETVNIVTVIDPRYLELWVYVNEAEAADVRRGASVRFFQAARRDRIFEARVERVSPAPETVDKVLYYPAIVPLAPLASLELRPDMNVQCQLKLDEARDVLSVPTQAVVVLSGRRAVYTEDGTGGVRAVYPEFGVRGGQRTQVLSGLEPGQRVAVAFDKAP